MHGSLIYMTGIESQPLPVQFPWTRKVGQGFMVVISRYLGSFKSMCPTFIYNADRGFASTSQEKFWDYFIIENYSNNIQGVCLGIENSFPSSSEVALTTV